MWDEYVKHGLSVFPVISMSKRPAVRKWEIYQERQPKKNEVAEWKNSNYNIAVVCGSVSGNLVVIDFDNPEMFKLVFPKIANGENKTWVVETPRPGIHVYFRTDKPIRSRRYADAKIDVKAEGGYVVAPPSTHPNGGKYTFLIGPEDGVEIAQVKADDFFALLEERLKELGFRAHIVEELKEDAARDDTGDPPWVRNMLQGVKEGMRDEVAIRLASYYINVKKLSPQAVESILLDWNTRNQPPIENAEDWVKTKIASAIRGGYVYGPTDELVRAFSQISAEESSEEAEVAKILQENLFNRLFEHAKKVVKEDDALLKTLILTSATSLTKSPTNIFVRGPPSIGKTHVTLNAVKYFSNAMILMGMSPKAIVHEYSAYDKDENAYIVDLWNKIIIFLEEPSSQVYEVLRPLMSHDKDEVEYKWVEQSKGKQRVVRSKIRGWPVFIFLGTTSKLLEDLVTRGIHTTPRMDMTKWMAIINFKGESYSKPFNYINSADHELRILQKAVQRIQEYIKMRNLGCVIPYANIITDVVKQTIMSKMPRTARDLEILFNLIGGSAALNVFRRPILRVNKNEKYYDFIIATMEDLYSVLDIWIDSLPASIAGITRVQFDIWQITKNLASSVSPEEITAKRIYNEWKQRFPDRPISYETLRKYLSVLEDRGLIISEKSGTKNVYEVVFFEQINTEEILTNIKNAINSDFVTNWIAEVKTMNNSYIIYNDNTCVPIHAFSTDEEQKLLSVIRGEFK